MHTRHFFTLLAMASYATTGYAWFRVACTEPLVQQRVDPIISPGYTPSQHVHTINGGSNFNPSYCYNDSRASSCSNCEVQQDLSNYWYPKLYFNDPATGMFEDVPNGGLLVYYQNRGDLDVANGGPGLKAHPPGLRMLTGDASRRTKRWPVGLGTQAELAERATQWSCLRYTEGVSGYDDNGTGFPTSDCEAGFNARLHMPACWDGRNLDSSDHKSHVAYLSGLDNGACPEGYPVGFMHVFYEVTWDVATFSSRWNTSDPTAWPFVYSTGDPTGYSWHGDFQNGWDISALQNAIDKCNNPNDDTGYGVTAACPYLNVTDASVADQCKINPIVNEVISGNLTKLPGCNPLQYGPGNATFYTDADCPS